MERIRILIVADDPSISSCCSAMVQDMGHDVLGCASGGKEAVEKSAALSPDLVIIDLGLDDMDGLERASQILQQRSLPIVIITASLDPDVMEKAEAVGAVGYVIKPFSRKELDAGLRLAWYRYKQIEALKNEIGDLQEMMKARKLIEQAKGLLMQQESISEAEAYKRMQNMSRNQSIAMIKLAEAIIMTHQLTNKPARAQRTGQN